MDCAGRLAELVTRLDNLRDHLIPEFRDTGDYSAIELDRTRGYRLLAHAEIEACIEDIAIGVAVDEYNGWIIDQRPRKPILMLVAYQNGNVAPPPKALEEILAGRADIKTRVTNAKNAFSLVVHDNHGIREDNILSLLMPVGVGEFDLDPAWLATIDSFGKWRGDTAHRSAGRAQHPPDPAGEVNTVSVITTGLREIAMFLDALQAA